MILSFNATIQKLKQFYAEIETNFHFTENYYLFHEDKFSRICCRVVRNVAIEIQRNNSDCGVYAITNIYALSYEVFQLEDLKYIQYLKYWTPSKVLDAQFQRLNSRTLNYKNQKCIKSNNRNVQYQ